MNTAKLLNNYLSKSIKNLDIDYNKIEELLGDFSDEQMVGFWRDYKINRDYSKTSTSNIPDWQTSKRAKFFELQIMSDECYPTQNAEGKYIYDIPKLKKHVSEILYNDSVQKINDKIRFKNLSIF